MSKKRHDTAAYLLFQWENFFSAFLTASRRSAWPVSGALDCLAVTLSLPALLFHLSLSSLPWYPSLFFTSPLVSPFHVALFSIFPLFLSYHLSPLSLHSSLSSFSPTSSLPLFLCFSLLISPSLPFSSLSSFSPSLFLLPSSLPNSSFSPSLPLHSLSPFPLFLLSTSSPLLSISPPLPSLLLSDLSLLPSLLPSFILPFLSSLSPLPPPPFSLSSLHLALDGRHSNRRQRWHCSLFSLPPRAPPAFLCSVLFIVPGIFMCF